jgi:phosphoribosylformylglycinamidine cyclo-ligase
VKKKAYAQAGVDIDLGNAVKSKLPKLLASTHRPEVLGKVGGFGGLFALKAGQYKQPVLVSSVDGVGTKLKIAFAMNKHNTVGADLVNHCVGDISVMGAEPLFFLDYIGTGRLDAEVFPQLISGFVKACKENRCALIGGETAQMPDFYAPGEYDVSGTIVGVVEKSDLLDGKGIKKGDRLIGIASSGLHTNGYSLARKIFLEKMRLELDSKPAGLKTTLGAELLKVHISYGNVIRMLLKKYNKPKSPRVLKGFAHITGGGFIDNIPRVLPRNCDAVVEKGSWPVLPIFKLIQESGFIDESEIYQVFNMGVGMVALVSRQQADAVLNDIKKMKHKAWHIGEVISGAGITKMV